MLESILTTRFGAMDAQLESIVTPLMALSADESLPLLMQLSAADLIDRFSEP